MTDAMKPVPKPGGRPPPRWGERLQDLIERLLASSALKIAAAVVAVLVVLGSCVDYVAPYEAGIKESRFAGGVSNELYAGGRWYVTGPGVTIHRFPMSVQALEMTSESKQSDNDDVRHVQRIEIDTSDGSKVRVDVTVLYRITDPYAVLTKIGPKRMFENSAVIPKTVLSLKKNLGQLLAEDFYHESRRLERSLAARDEMNQLLKDVGIAVDHVLIRQYYYEKGYQQQIENRKVQDQLVFTNRSQAEAAKEDAVRRRIESEGLAATDVEKQRGEAEVTKIRAEADLYKTRKEAEGDMLVQVAEAKGTQLVNQAYASSGSDNLVALDMAKVLEGIELMIITDEKNGVNPLDIDAMARMLGAR
jgi:regulator of protease activity HflC (stomatin/prohibitin superfamily)